MTSAFDSGFQKSTQLNIPSLSPPLHTMSPVYLVEEQTNPSTDFFVLPAILANNRQVIRCCHAELPHAADLSGATVVFVRYVPANWVRLVGSARTTLAALIFFMDDDVLDLDASVGMPWRYRFKLTRLARRRLQWLQQQKAELWVSTLYLQQKYADWHPRLVLPSPVETPDDVRRVFYHGSASHEADIRWLKPVITEAMRHDHKLVFEIIGGQNIYRLYKDLPRVSVIHPMKWPAYQAFLSLQDRHVGLNPLHEIPFNRARSYTKFFDITRCKAVGIYSPNTACSEIIRDGHDGLIVNLNQEDWAEAILNLVQNDALRQTLLTNAEAKLRALAKQSQQSYAGLL